jgi:hypothetical protein
MNAHADQTQENESQVVSAMDSQMQSGGEATFQFVDNRAETVAQMKLQEMANNSPQVSQLRAFQEMANNSAKAKKTAQLQAIADKHSARQQVPIQKKENNTGLPDNLKTGMENLSGISLDDVKVHYNSDKPAQLQAHAYAQGSGIHLASRQEKHLPHELAHVVQQKEGRVKPTAQLKGKTPINDDVGLEREADIMGIQAMDFQSESIQLSSNPITDSYYQLKPVQRSVIQLNKEVSVDVVDMASGFTWTYFKKLIVDQGPEFAYNQILERACLYLTQQALSNLTIQGFINIIAPYVRILREVVNIIESIPHSLQVALLYGIGWSIRQFSTLCLGGLISEQRIHQLITGGVSVSEKLALVIELLDDATHPERGNWLYNAVVGAVSSISGSSEQEADVSETPQISPKSDTKFFWIDAHPPKLAEWDEDDSNTRAGMQLGASFGVNLFDYSMGADEVTLNLPYSGDWSVDFKNILLLSENVGLSGIFTGGPVSAPLIRLDSKGLNKLEVIVKDLNIGDTLKAPKVNTEYDRGADSINFTGEAELDVLKHPITGEFDLDINTKGEFNKGSLKVTDKSSFEIIPGRLTMTNPTFWGEFSKGKSPNIGAIGDLDIKLMDGLNVAAKALSLAYIGEKGFEGKVDLITVDINLTEDSLVRFEMLKAKVNSEGFSADTIRLTYAYKSAIEEDASDDEEVQNKASQKSDLSKDEIGSLLPGFDPSFFGGSLEGLVVEASAAGITIDKDGINAKSNSKELIKLSAKLFGVNGSFDGKKGKGTIDGDFGPKEWNTPSLQAHFPIIPGVVHAHAGITAGVGFGANLNGKLTRIGANSDNPNETKWVIGGGAKITANGNIEINIGGGLGDPLIIALQGEMFAKAKAELIGDANLTGTLLINSDTNAMRVSEKPTEKISGNYKVGAALTASIGGRIKGRALYIFESTLYQVHFKEWELGKAEITGSFGDDQKGKGNKLTFDGKDKPNSPPTAVAEVPSLAFLKKLESDSSLKVTDGNHLYRLMHDLADHEIPESQLSDEKRYEYMLLINSRNSSDAQITEEEMFGAIARRYDSESGTMISYVMEPEEWKQYSSTSSNWGGNTRRSSIDAIDKLVIRYFAARTSGSDNYQEQYDILNLLIEQTEIYEAQRIVSRKEMTFKLRFEAQKDQEVLLEKIKLNSQ